MNIAARKIISSIIITAFFFTNVVLPDVGALTFKLPDWVTLYQAICSWPVVELPVFDTS